MSRRYSRCQNVQLISQNPAASQCFSRVFDIAKQHIRSVERNDYVQKSLICEITELLVIDIDSIGCADTSFLIFLAASFTPGVPVILITDQTIDNSTKKRYRSGGALAVVQLTDTSNFTTN